MDVIPGKQPTPGAVIMLSVVKSLGRAGTFRAVLDVNVSKNVIIPRG